MKKKARLTIINEPKPPSDADKLLHGLKLIGTFILVTIIILVFGTLWNKTVTKASREYIEWLDE
jgi:hypothetical protein